MQNTLKKQKKTDRMRQYMISITEQQLRENGIENVKLRTVSDEAGYNSATIYNYFKDFDHLILYSSFKFLEDYPQRLKEKMPACHNALERYISIYGVFARQTFRYPEIFWNMFYGKHSKELDEIVKEYYRLFPDEMKDSGAELVKLLSTGDIFAREHILVKAIADEGFIAQDTVPQIVNIAIWSHEYLLHEMVQNKELSVEEQAKKYEDSMHFLLKNALLPSVPPNTL